MPEDVNMPEDHKLPEEAETPPAQVVEAATVATAGKEPRAQLFADLTRPVAEAKIPPGELCRYRHPVFQTESDS